MNGSCERCGGPIVLLREPAPGIPPKRFCSPRCRDKAGKSRWKARRRAAAKLEKNQ